MKFKKEKLINLLFLFLIIFSLSFISIFSVKVYAGDDSVHEISGSIGADTDADTDDLETGLTGNVPNCNPLSVSNGNVAAYPTCTITCNSGYSLSGSSCVKNSSSGGSSGGGGSNDIKCTTVIYSDWDSVCTGNFQYRAVVSKSPANCSLNTAQQVATYRTCQTTVSTPTTSTSTDTKTTTTSSSNLSGNLLKEQVLTREKTRLTTINNNLAKRLSGGILLQVEEKGEAWYINPLDLKRYYLGRPADAFNIMRSLGLGVKHSVITAGPIPVRLYGRILIDVEDHGKAYWINPVDGGRNYLGRPDDAFRILRDNGLGISNANINKIALGYL